jgi:putative ubiquitin-RnfH superfamily antitoxin RatB of RatAB toxin-antitoxin module
VWGKLTHLGDALRENDRVEIYRPLLVDPKEARRLRYRRQRERNKR